MLPPVVFSENFYIIDRNTFSENFHLDISEKM